MSTKTLLIGLVWLTVLAVFAFMFWLLEKTWINYATHTLLLDEEQMITITCSAMAIPCALYVLWGLKKVNELSASAPAETCRNAVLTQVLQPIGWSLMFIAFTLSGSREQWHVARGVYFSIAIAASSLVLSTYILLFKLTKGRGHIIGVACWLTVLCLFVYRLIWGTPSKGLLG